MKEAAAEKLIPPVLTRKTANNHNNGPLQTTSQEMPCVPSNPDTSPPRKKKTPASKLPTLESSGSFKAAAAGAGREVNVLLSKYAQVLSERAAADTSQMKELEEILRKARNLESFLKEKKSHLRKTLALISDKLQG